MRKNKHSTIVPRCKPFNAHLVRFLQSVLDFSWDKLPSYKDIAKPTGWLYSLQKQPLPEITKLQQNFDRIPEQYFARLGYKKSTFEPIKSMSVADALGFVKQHL